MPTSFTLHRIEWQAAEPLFQDVRIAACTSGLLDAAEVGLIFHSDRGSQYCSHAFQNTLTEYGMQSSMPQREAIHYAASRMWSCHSRKGNCWEREAYPLGAMRQRKACGDH